MGIIHIDMVTKRVFQSLSAITLGRHKMNDPRYEFLTEEKNGEVVSCIVNNAEIKDVPGIDYELSINPDNPDKIDALQIIINDESKKLGDVFMQLPYGVIKKNVPGIGATTLDVYRQYIEKDAALERRFQPVQVDEPTVEDTISILRGL